MIRSMKTQITNAQKGISPGESSDTFSPEGELAVREDVKTKKPSMYKVFILNDDYTPMEFVVELLELIFSKTREEATRIMLHVHRKGAGLCGVYTFDIAETKVTQVLQAARAAQHPLQCKMEKE